MSGTIIVGAGQAGLQVAVALRQGGYRKPVILLGDERHTPYERPPLSKEFLAGKRTAAQLTLRKPDFYSSQGIDLRTGVRVLSLDRSAGRVHLADGSHLAYERLVWAAGGRARRLSCPGADAAGLHYIRTIDDVAALSDALAGGMKRVVLVGGGYIGLETAAVLRGLGHDVTVLEAQDHLLARVTAPPISDFYRDIHRAEGVSIRLGTALSGLRAVAGRINGVVLADSEVLAADIVIAGIGITPNIEPLAEAGIDCPNGVRVDATCTSNDPAILAVGDCALFPSPYTDRPVRLESVPNAMEQARIAAATICGTPAPSPSVPWFWSNQYDLRLQSAGLNMGWDQIEMIGNPAERKFALRYFREGRLISADCINMPAEFAQMKKQIRE
ncbi:FAD-dependent oxidoreductase [Niveispirillum sp. BGYR6]|uniref:NAD(P)/FAD-dependent oxidoreductase n=1 Tax=Niveispirillum sp. BGYR6 TaxID=2971249 RepID=UPI0022B9AD57|nr:FAD-dependent oxidoreductase [Niveispirillum sp. BGYR6]MDG5496177.1 FAD-dependent oxidoreductase [Niveispirillum sp. BGYR6]